MDIDFTETHKVIHLSTKAMRDRLNGGWTSDVIHMAEYHDILFVIDRCSGVGAAGISVIRCDDVTPTTTAGLPGGRYRYSTTPDVYTAWAAMPTSSGFETAITPDNTYEVHVTSDEVGGSSNFEYVRLKCAEYTNSPVDINMIAILYNQRYAEDIDQVTSIT